MLKMEPAISVVRREVPIMIAGARDAGEPQIGDQPPGYALNRLVLWGRWFRFDTHALRRSSQVVNDLASADEARDKQAK
jgi:hypothetical protein